MSTDEHREVWASRAEGGIVWAGRAVPDRRVSATDGEGRRVRRKPQVTIPFVMSHSGGTWRSVLMGDASSAGEASDRLARRVVTQRGGDWATEGQGCRRGRARLGYGRRYDGAG